MPVVRINLLQLTLLPLVVINPLIWLFVKINLTTASEIDKQIALGKMDGSLRFSFPAKRGKIDISADAKISPYSEIEIKHDYFI